MDEIKPLGPAVAKQTLVERVVNAVTGNKARHCAQRGCSFEATTDPEICPVCGNPFIPS